MLPESLRSCVCTAHSYRSRGAHFGSRLSSQWFTCVACGRPCLVLTCYMTVLLFPTEIIWERDEDSVARGAFPQEGLDYINGPLDITVRAYAAAVETARHAADRADWALHCELLGIPRDSTIEFRKTEPTGRIFQRPDGTEVEDTSVLKRFDKMSDDSRGYRAVHWTIMPPTLPKLPACLTAFVLVAKPDEDRWREVDRAESAALCVPPDPRRTAHDERFKKIFDEVAASAGYFKPVEIENQYYNDRLNSEPWYEFTIGDRKFTVGPRKHVINITVALSRDAILCGRSMETTHLRSLARRDDVTYTADDQWKSDMVHAAKITIHAWNAEKCVEYLKAAIS